MPRFAANLTFLFAELPYEERFGAAARAGFAAVEILNPYDVAIKVTQRALLASGLPLVLINAPPPNYTGGAPGFAAVSEGQARFQSDIRRVLRVAGELRPQVIHVMAGYVSGPEAAARFVENLRWAADLAPDQQFSIEPLNPVSQPDYFLNDYGQAAELLAQIDRPNVGLQFDSFHAQMIHGDATGIWSRYRDLIVHAQIGQSPDRTAPDSGEIDFPALFTAIDHSGYDGWVSAEYFPGDDTLSGLDWLKGA